jgi:hypothetical protein
MARGTGIDYWRWARLVLLICVVVFVICSVILTHYNLYDPNSRPASGPASGDAGRTTTPSPALRGKLPQVKDFAKGKHTVRNVSSWKGSCKESLVPSCPMYQYVQFWSPKFRVDDCFQSLLRKPLTQLPLKQQKFLLFEPDRGGWNNIRMAAETAIIIAHATGRVLVLPPETHWYLLDKATNKHELFRLVYMHVISVVFTLLRTQSTMTINLTSESILILLRFVNFCISCLLAYLPP